MFKGCDLPQEIKKHRRYFWHTNHNFKPHPMTLTNHVFVSFLFLSLASSCQLAEVHVDCLTDDCATDSTMAAPEETPTFSGYYRLKTKFRGEAESLDDGQGTARIANGGIFMNLHDENSPHQLWRLDTLANGFFRLKTKASGDLKSVEANGYESPVYDGVSFMNRQQNVIGQYWYLEAADDDYFKLKSPLHENRCLEGNELNGKLKAGATFMNDCSGAIGQLWRLEKVYE